MQKRMKERKKKKKLIPEEQRERPAACVDLTLSLVPKTEQQELHISPDINAMDTTRLLLSNGSRAVAITRNGAGASSGGGMDFGKRGNI